MRFAHVITSAGPRLLTAGASDWVDVANLASDERLATLSGLLAAGPAAWEHLRARLGGAAATPAPPVPTAPVHDRPERIFCVGRNYAEHRSEFGNAPTPWPEVFLRLGWSVIGPYDDVLRPSVSERLDYEGELALIIGRPAATSPLRKRSPTCSATPWPTTSACATGSTGAASGQAARTSTPRCRSGRCSSRRTSSTPVTSR